MSFFPITLGALIFTLPTTALIMGFGRSVQAGTAYYACEVCEIIAYGYVCVPIVD